jgi:hypothetical protein
MPGFDNRLALLIGIQHYPSLGSLNTPYQDVRLMRRTLQRCGFEDDNIITIPADPDQRVSASDMRRAVTQFASRLAEVGAQPTDENACAVVYFAGHGLTHEHESLLLSDYASLEPGDLAAESLPLSELVQKVGRLDFPVVVLIDACQSLSRSRGLQREPVSLPSFLVGDMHVDLATCPGEIAFDGVFNSPYASALSEQMPIEGRSIGDMLVAVRRSVRSSSQDRQNPQSMSSVSSSHSFIPRGRAMEQDGTMSPNSSSTLGRTRSGALGPRRNYGPNEIRQKGHLIHKLKAKDTSGRWAYYFVLVEPQFETGFLSAIEGEGTVDLEHYGVVLASNYGTEPNAEICQFLEATYGFKIEASQPTPAPSPTPTPRSSAPPPMLVAVRQSLGMGSWRWLVMWIAPENRMRFAHAADDLLAFDRSGLGADGKGILGGLRKAVDTIGASHFNIDRLASFGNVLFRGNGADVPPSIQLQILQRFNVQFDWTDWERLNGTTVDLS